VKDHVNPVHRAGAERSPIATAVSTQIAVQRVDVFRAKRLQWEVAEARAEMVVDDAFGLANGRW
jgi:hypothetical protein